ncbi:unnamed protein product [Amoebophrya sp. A25]|nr:unnamed protein product [Amoebophrya sp. A25]|eukprot:GSA25T00006139001.1
MGVRPNKKKTEFIALFNPRLTSWVRYLGNWLDIEEDGRRRVGRMISALTEVDRVSGAADTSTDFTVTLTSRVRSRGSFAVGGRPSTALQIKQRQTVMNTAVCRLSGMPRYALRRYHCPISRLMRLRRVPSEGDFTRYSQCSFIGHLIRTDPSRLSRRALFGFCVAGRPGFDWRLLPANERRRPGQVGPRIWQEVKDSLALVMGDRDSSQVVAIALSRRHWNTVLYELRIKLTMDHYATDKGASLESLRVARLYWLEQYSKRGDALPDLDPQCRTGFSWFNEDGSFADTALDKVWRQRVLPEYEPQMRCRFCPFSLPGWDERFALQLVQAEGRIALRPSDAAAAAGLSALAIVDHEASCPHRSGALMCDESRFICPASFRSGDICEVVSSLHVRSTPEDKDLHSVLRLFSPDEIRSVFSPALFAGGLDAEHWSRLVGAAPLEWEREVVAFSDFRFPCVGPQGSAAGSSSSSGALVPGTQSLLLGGRVECFCGECRRWTSRAQRRDKSGRGRLGSLLSPTSSSSILFTSSSSSSVGSESSADRGAAACARVGDDERSGIRAIGGSLDDLLAEPGVSRRSSVLISPEFRFGDGRGRRFESFLAAFRHMRRLKYDRSAATFMSAITVPSAKKPGEKVSKVKPRPRLAIDGGIRKPKALPPSVVSVTGVAPSSAASLGRLPTGIQWHTTWSGASKSVFGGCFRVYTKVKHDGVSRIIFENVTAEKNGNDLRLALLEAKAILQRMKDEPGPFLASRAAWREKRRINAATKHDGAPRASGDLSTKPTKRRK